MFPVSEGTGGVSLVVLVVKTLHPSAGDLGLILGQGTRSHMPQLRPGVAKRKYRDLIQGFKSKRHCGKQVTDTRNSNNNTS